ncbi:MAG: prolipoprotein diacylglyceryl transferase [Lachnospiraceae bacterium]|nr:prolipoprotein diacylglyceryl transferase [Lachnospiraceae bacterium]
MLPYIDLGFVKLSLYGPIFLVGAVIAIIIVRLLAKKAGVERSDALFAVIYGMIGLVIGAKLLYFFTKLPSIIAKFDIYIDLFKMDYVKALDFAFGGMVFYGGLIGFALGVIRYCKHFKVPVWGLVDLYTPFLPFVHGFGRIGCFFAGCCYGIEYNGPLSVHFPYNEVVPQLSEVSRFPVQLVEAGLNFICFAVLITLMRKELNRAEGDRKLKQGQLCGIYLVYYIVVRTLLEFLRGDALRGKIGFLSTSQIISVLLIIPAVLLLRAKNRERVFFVPATENHITKTQGIDKNK